MGFNPLSMVVGAATGFAFAYLTDSTLVGVLAAALCGMAISGAIGGVSRSLAESGRSRSYDMYATSGTSG